MIILDLLRAAIGIGRPLPLVQTIPCITIRYTSSGRTERGDVSDMLSTIIRNGKLLRGATRF